MGMMNFDNIYNGKRVLITGNTGFKGSWLTMWLLQLGADVYGYSNTVLTRPAMYKVLKLEKHIHQQWEDIRDSEKFVNYVKKIEPDFIFHLAAQAIVSTSYKQPLDTITTNVVGTASVMEALRLYDKPVTAVIITSDKAYDNVEWLWGYRETDRLGGKDVYSGSKGAAELVIKSYWHSFLKNKNNLRLGIARAGNVIGGGDWSADRIVVDTIKAFADNQPVEIRSPKATRPWQHVLEPLSGYLRLGEVLYLRETDINGEAFNFGPRAGEPKTVKQLVEDIAKIWGIDNPIRISGDIPFNEATLLRLNCDKALNLLQWQATLTYEETVRYVAEWYKAFYEKNTDMYPFTQQQINNYCNLH